MSLEISLSLNFPNEVVTGFIYGISDKVKYLHSWIEFNKDGNEYVIDYTMNVIMNKEGYYFIRQAEELSRISNQDILFDSKISINSKVYLVFRHEIMKELEKNSFLFPDYGKVKYK